MKNCAMHALAERIMSYVGTNVGLPIKADAGFEVKRLRQEMWEVKQQMYEAAKQQ